MRRLLIWVTAAVAMTTFVAPMEVRAADTGSCAESASVNRFKGFAKVLASVAGAELVLENQSLNICSSASDGSRGNFIWPGIDPNDGHVWSIVQLGLGRCQFTNYADCNNYGTHQWWAWGRDHLSSGCTGFSDVAPSPRFMGAFPASSKTYTVVETATQWQFKVGGTVKEFIGTSSICWSPKRAMWTGESWDIADAIGGTAGNPFHVSGALYESTVGGAWSNSNWGTGNVCNLAPTDARYKCNAPTGTSMDLWTVQP
jgi:hypothetical protein